MLGFTLHVRQTVLALALHVWVYYEDLSQYCCVHCWVYWSWYY